MCHILGSSYLTENLFLSFTDSSDPIEFFSQDLQYWQQTGIRTKRFREILDHLRIPDGYHGIQWSHVPQPIQSTICTLCEVFIQTVLDMVTDGSSKEEVEESMIHMCVLFNIETERVCRGTIELNTVRRNA